jgi:LmbE family N-acetylglucosaminyl deacetylase
MNIVNNRLSNIYRVVLVGLLALALPIASPRAQQPANHQTSEDRVALYQALLDLTNPWTVMCVAAHPDDEDGTSLVVMRRKYGANTVSLFTTFGEGGQNAIGPELYEELGAIRARETRAASEIQGSQPYFLGLNDFGFSKSAEEAFQKWGHEEALRRMVQHIRRLRPDVIITNHSTTSNDHGHHQATARLVVEAFDAAADSRRFPEQLKDGITTWQVQRLFVRVRGSQSTAADAQIVTIDPNERDSVRGTVFAEQALSALQKHATQGPWPKSFAEYSARFRAFSGQGGATGVMPLIRYRLAREAKGTNTLPSDSHSFVEGLTLPGGLADLVTPPKIDGRPVTEFVDQRERLLLPLGSAFTTLMKYSHSEPNAPDRFRLSLVLNRIDRALALAHGISAQLKGPDVLSPGTSASFFLVVSNRGSKPVRVAKNSLTTGGENLIGLPCCPSISSDTVIAPGGELTLPLKYEVPVDAKLTVPHASHLYDARVFGTSVHATPQLTGDATFYYGGHKWVDVAPAVEISRISPSPLVLSHGLNKPLTFSVELINHQSQPFQGKLSANGESVPVNLPALATKNLELQLSRPLAASTSKLEFTVSGSAKESATVPVFMVNAKVASNLRIGYIRGFDFSLPHALNALGVESKELSADEIKTADLSKFTSIIVDNRVYESQPELIAVNQKLLEYANAGGNLIVFYHKSDEWNPSPQRNRPQLAPYNLLLGNQRITDENAPITFIEPEHPLLNSPNKLNQDDFKDWIQERGLYYPRDWDPQFHALLQSNDPNEAPLKGGLLIADYGKGHYIYSSMVWYRQLRGGVPGAYRMLANMISYGRAQ